MEEQRFYEGFGRAVRRARLRRHLTQATLAQRLNLRRTSITNLEAGQQGVSAYALLSLADVLGISAARLLHEAQHGEGVTEEPSNLDQWTSSLIQKARATRTRKPA